MIEEVIEDWQNIPEFPNYDISSLGRVYNRKHDSMMSVSYTNHGHAKITLTCEWSGERFTRSVALLVAEAFVEAPNLLCDQITLLDGDLTNLCAENIVWRPQWFAWKYTRQLKAEQPLHYRNLVVYNIVFEEEYESILVAGMTEGLLFDDIWRSTYTGAALFPTGSVFEILERV